jgi:hypothetical protein
VRGVLLAGAAAAAALLATGWRSGSNHRSRCLGVVATGCTCRRLLSCSVAVLAAAAAGFACSVGSAQGHILPLACQAGQLSL